MMGAVQALSSLPFFAVYLVAGVLAVSRWDRHPTTSLLVVTSAALAFVSRGVMFVLPAVLMREGGDMQWVQVGYAITGLVSTVALGCLVAAVFADRNRNDGPPPSQFR